MGLVLGPAASKWQREGRGLQIERCALASLAAGCDDRLTHTTRAGDIVLFSDGLSELQGMANDLVSSTSAEGLRIAADKVHLWSSARPARIRIAGRTTLWPRASAWPPGRCLSMNAGSIWRAALTTGTADGTPRGH